MLTWYFKQIQYFAGIDLLTWFSAILNVTICACLQKDISLVEADFYYSKTLK